MKRVAIIGGGLSGLTLTYFLNKNHPEISIDIYEKNAQLGGKIKALKFLDGYLTFGPKTVVLKPNTILEKIVFELGLQDKILFPQETAKKRMISYQGKLISLPTKPWEILKFPFIQMIPDLIREFFVPKKIEDETVGEFFSRRFGKICKNLLADPLMRGIYGGGVDSISICQSLRILKDLEIQYGSVLKGLFKSSSSKRKIFSFEKGFYSFIQKLEESIQATIHLNCPVQIIDAAEKKVILSSAIGKKEYDAVVLATDVTGLLQFIPISLRNQLQKGVQSITQVVLVYEKKIPLDAFGCLFPKVEENKVMGILFDSAIFPANQTILTVMIEGVDDEQDEFIRLSREILKKYLHVDAEPFQVFVEKYKDGIFHPTLEHRKNREEIDRYFKEKSPQIAVLGANLNGVSVADQIENAYHFAKKFLENP